MVLRKSAVGAALLAALVLVVQIGSDIVVDSFVEGTFGWLPQLDTVGQTVAVYMYLFNGLEFGLGIIAVFGLGYWAGSQLSLKVEYKRFVLAVAAGGMVGYLVAGSVALTVAYGGIGFPTLDSFGVVTLLLAAGVPLGVGIQFAVVAFAGAAFANVTGGTFGSAPNKNSTEIPAESAD